jgi:hypothetical protein
MTIQKLASAIAFREGKKSQARIGDIREILRIMVDMEAESLHINGDPEAAPLHVMTEATNKALDKLRRRRKPKAIRRAGSKKRV